MPYELSAEALWWVSSTVAQAVVALLAFGAFLAIDRLGRIRDAVSYVRTVSGSELAPLRSLWDSMRSALSETVLDPKSNERQSVQEYLAKLERIPNVKISAYVEEYGLAREIGEALLTSRGELGEIAERARVLQTNLDAIQRSVTLLNPIFEIADRLNSDLRIMSFCGLIAFTFSLAIATLAKPLAKDLIPLAGFLVLVYALMVLATVVFAARLARSCFATPVTR